MSEQRAMLATLDEYAEEYCAKDLTGLMAVFVDAEHISLIGTGADELYSGRMGLHPYSSATFGALRQSNSNGNGKMLPFTEMPPPPQSH